MKRGGRSDGGNSLTAISKKLSWALRHGIVELGLDMSSSGFVRVDQLLAHPQFSRFSLSQINEVVRTNDKQRFTLKEEDGVLLIRANQGHTLKLVTDDLLTPITDPYQFPLVIHGTFPEPWAIIQRRGLHRMARNHIHMAAGLPTDATVISGARKSATVLIEIDVPLAMSEGIKFFVSDNNVILTEGRHGYLSPRYFKRVTVEGRDINFHYNPLTLDYIFVLDFEATCDSDRRFGPQEIIEFPVVVLDLRTFEVVDIFHRYVKPVINPILTQFCTELTGINQEMVTGCDELRQVMADFDSFQRRFEGKSWIFATCGDWDLKQCLYAECIEKSILVPEYFNTWLNVKTLFPTKCGGMPDMLNALNLPLEGRHHSGIDDAKNITKILSTLLQSGAGLTQADLSTKSQKQLNTASKKLNTN